MKNSSGAIGAAKAPPYLVSHRRIINVIRIMYPRNSATSRVAEEGRKKGWGIAEVERRVFILWDISRRYQSAEGKGEGDGKGEGGGDGACTKGTPTVPSRSFTPTGAYTLPPQSRSHDHCGADAKPMYFAFVAFCAYSKKKILSQLESNKPAIFGRQE